MSKFSKSKSIFILIAASIGSNVLGLFRNHFFASKIPTEELSSYYAAFRIPDLIFNLIVLGVLSSIFIPVFMGEVEKGDKKSAFRFANNMVNFTILFVSFFSIVLFFLMPYLTNLIVPGFSEAAKISTTQMARFLLISPIIFGLSSIAGGILNSFKKFTAYALAPLFYNLGIILGTVFLADEYGVFGIVIGVLFGAFLHLLIQLPSIIRLGYDYQPILDFKDKALGEIIKLAPPRIGGLMASQANFFILTIFGSLIGGGSISYLNLANDTQTFVSVVFGISFATVAFPLMTEKISQEKTSEFITEFSKTFRQILYFVIPASVGLILLRGQITRLILGYGYFKFIDTKLTAAVLGVLALSLFAQATIPLLVRAFYALKDTKTPFYASFVAVFVNLIGSFTLPSLFANYQASSDGEITFAVVGLAVSFTLASIVNMLFLFFSLHKKIGDLEDFKIITSLLKISLAVLVMIFSVQSLKYLISPIIDPVRPVSGFLIQTGLVISGGALTYFLMTYFLKCEGISGVKDLFRRYFKRET